MKTKTQKPRPGLRIYRLPASGSNRLFVVYRGEMHIGSFRSMDELKKIYPDAVYKGHEVVRIGLGVNVLRKTKEG